MTYRVKVRDAVDGRWKELPEKFDTHEQAEQVAASKALPGSDAWLVERVS